MNDKSIATDNPIWHKELLTVAEVAEHLRVSRVTVWRWCRKGILPAFQVGRVWRIRRADLLALEETMSSEPFPFSAPSQTAQACPADTETSESEWN